MVRRLTLPLALCVLVAACTGSSADTTTTTGPSDSPSTTEAVQGSTTTTSPVPTTTTTLATAPTTDPDLSGLEGLSEALKEQLEQLIVEAQEIRDLPFLSPPIIRVVSNEELSDLVRAEIADNAEDFPQDESMYKLLGLLAEEADFESIVTDLYGEQVAGFYDGETGEIVVPARDEGFSLLQQGTMIHELVHSLTDQHFSFNEVFRQMVDEERLDEATAYQALIEGDATLAEVLWIQTLSQREIGELIAESLSIDSSALDASPRFLTESLLFPYDTGLAFTQELFAEDRWSGINDAYRRMVNLPGSSEQVITPADYTEDLPMEVEIEPLELDGYELVRTSVWGEQGFRLMLNQGSTASSTAVAADGWGGDSYHQWFDGVNSALLIVYEGDTTGDVLELEEALLEYAFESFPEENFAWVEQLDGALYFIAADETSVGEFIRASVGLDAVGS